MRVVAYLFAMSGLVAAALIAIRGQRGPLTLYAWSCLPLIGFSLIAPEIVPVLWQPAPPPTGPRLHALATLLCGCAAGLGASRCIAPILYRDFDRRLLASDTATRKARQFLGGMAVVGCVVGWQASVAVACLTICLALIGSSLWYRRWNLEFDDMTAWIWLALLVFRILWAPAVQVGVVSAAVPSITWCAIGLIGLAFLAWSFRLVIPALPSWHADQSPPNVRHIIRTSNESPNYTGEGDIVSTPILPVDLNLPTNAEEDYGIDGLTTSGAAVEPSEDSKQPELPKLQTFSIDQDGKVQVNLPPDDPSSPPAS